MKAYHDIAGDGGSRILEQVVEQRARIAEALSGVRHVLAVGSGKGGVGKSTLTFQLAAALRAQGLEIAVLDADFNGPSQARMAGVTDAFPVPGRDARAALPRTRDGIAVFSMGSLVPEGQAVDFDTVSSGESHTWRATKEFAVLGEVLSGFEWGRRDVLLVDLPPGAERTFQYAEFLGPATAFLIVTIPSELSLGVVARSLAALARTPNRVLGYVLNMDGYWCEECGEVKPLFPNAGAAELPVPCLGRVPFDPALARSCDEGTPLAHATASTTFPFLRAIAERVLPILESER